MYVANCLGSLLADATLKFCRWNYVLQLNSDARVGDAETCCVLLGQPSRIFQITVIVSSFSGLHLNQVRRSHMRHGCRQLVAAGGSWRRLPAL